MSLDEGLDKTILWIKTNLDRFRVGIYKFQERGNL